MPLVGSVSFKAVLQRGNRFQVPKLVRWEFKLEPAQVLKVKVTPVGAHGESESFYGRMTSGGRITVPKLALDLLEKRTVGGKSLVGYVMDVQLQPAAGVKP